MTKNLPKAINIEHRWLHAISTFLACLCVFTVIISTNAKAENLIAVDIESVTQLPNNVSATRIWQHRDTLIAVDENTLWTLPQATNVWTEMQPLFQPNISAIANSEKYTYLLLANPVSGLTEAISPFTFDSSAQPNKVTMLPQALTSAAGSILGDTLYIAGTTPTGLAQLLSLDLSTDNTSWESHTAWEGTAGLVSSVVGQNYTLHVTLKNPDIEQETVLQWTPKEGWQERASFSGQIIEGTARAIGQGHVLYLLSTADASALTMLSFSAITGSSVELDRWDSRSAAFGTGWQKGILWVESQNNNQAVLEFAALQSRPKLLSTLDWAVLGIYLIAMLGMGLYFYLKDAQSSESNFFLGGRSIPFWAAGISLYASNASSISYIAVPAKAFATNWQYLMSNLIVVVGLIFVAIWIAPLLRRLNLTSVFEYLETRFHPSIRMLSSVLFIVFQLGGRMTVILYLPSLALSTVTGIDITICILVMGFVTICYTVLGGMKAVIWTDVLQLFVMFGGTIFAIIFIISKLDGGTAEFISTALADDKFKLVDWSFNLTEATVWGFVFLVFFDTILTFPKDQVLMQRLFSTSSPKQAGRSMWTFSAIVIPGSAMFFLIGTALYVFYQLHPERMDPSLSLDATFPLFISAELPVGITGLIIAGIFAAAMSTLSSILNSVATVSTVDFYEKWNTNKNEKTNVRFAEIVTVIAGLIGISLALLLSRFNISSLLDVALELWGLLGGGFAGAYTLGMFTRRANWQGVMVGVIVSFMVTFFAWSIDLVHPYFYMPLSVFVCIVVGYSASWFFPAPEHTEGLTIFLDKDGSQARDDDNKLAP